MIAMCSLCNDTSLTTRPSGMIESCTSCRAFELAWQPYYDWLDEMAKKKKAKMEGKPYERKTHEGKTMTSDDWNAKILATWQQFIAATPRNTDWLAAFDRHMRENRELYEHLPSKSAGEKS